MARIKQTAAVSAATSGKVPRKSVRPGTGTPVKGAEKGGKGVKRPAVAEAKKVKEAKEQRVALKAPKRQAQIIEAAAKEAVEGDGAVKERAKPKIKQATVAKRKSGRLWKRETIIPRSFVRARLLRAMDDSLRKGRIDVAGAGGLRLTAVATTVAHRMLDDFLFDVAAMGTYMSRETARFPDNRPRKGPVTKAHLMFAAQTCANKQL